MLGFPVRIGLKTPCLGVDMLGEFAVFCAQNGRCIPAQIGALRENI
mgnify:CR=1 FL=1